MGLVRSELLAVVGIVVEIAFFLSEMVIGERTKSIALVADSYRVLTDAMSILVSGICASRVEKLQTERNTFGWVRTDVLGAFVNGVFLLATLFSVIVESLKRLVTIQELEEPYLVLVLGIVGLIINTGVLMLYGTKAYRHKQKQKKTKNLPSAIEIDEEKVPLDSGGTKTATVGIMLPATEITSRKLSVGWLFIHVLGNFFGSLTIITIAILGIYGKYDWCHYADPVLTICMVAILVTSTCPLLKESAHIMLQTVPQHFDVDILKAKLKKQIPELVNIHELHVWQLTGQAAIVTLHFVSSAGHDYVTTIQRIKDFMFKQGISNVTIQPEILQQEYGVFGSTQCLLTCSDQEQCSPKTCCHILDCATDKDQCQLSHRHSCHEGHGESTSGSSTNITYPDCSADTTQTVPVFSYRISPKSIALQMNNDIDHIKVNTMFEHVTTV